MRLIRAASAVFTLALVYAISGTRLQRTRTSRTVSHGATGNTH